MMKDEAPAGEARSVAPTSAAKIDLMTNLLAFCSLMTNRGSRRKFPPCAVASYGGAYEAGFAPKGAEFSAVIQMVVAAALFAVNSKRSCDIPAPSAAEHRRNRAVIEASRGQAIG